MDEQSHEPEEPERSKIEGETVYLTAQLETRTRFEIRPQVFVPAAFIVVVFALLGAVFPDTLAEAFAALQGSIVEGLGWFYKLAVSVFLVFVVWLALSRHGKKRLGPDDARPDFGVFSWFAMLFSAGMGIGLLFFSVAEPISHFGVSPPPGAPAEAGTPEAAQHAMTITFFHWGLHAWAIYIVVGLALCYFAYRRGLPLALRSAFHPLLGDRIYGWGGDAIDVLAIVGTLFGVATSLGIGAIQISAGIGFLSGIEAGLGWQLSLVAVITVIATGSVVSGLDRGIRRLSLLNVVLSGLLTLFVLVAGPTVFILDGLVHSLGDYAVQVAGLSLETYPFATGDWEALWTLFYWGWWVSWSPFVGMFIARISRGRTIREFITGVLLAPTVVTFIFLAVFGWAAFDADMAGSGSITAAVEANPDVALFALLDGLPDRRAHLPARDLRHHGLLRHVVGLRIPRRRHPRFRGQRGAASSDSHLLGAHGRGRGRHPPGRRRGDRSRRTPASVHRDRGAAGHPHSGRVLGAGARVPAGGGGSFIDRGVGRLRAAPYHRWSTCNALRRSIPSAVHPGGSVTSSHASM
ncbi:MAG: BCCT family transporter [Gemmatimonadota bacterium]|nr:BCCT family transporter [Gemmatimonadota bacterium]